MKTQHLEMHFPYPTSYHKLPTTLPSYMSSVWTADDFMTGVAWRAAPEHETEAVDTTILMLDEMVKHAVQDATQSYDLDLRWEAVAWLWVCCPDIADQLLLTLPETQPAHLDLQQQAMAYLARYPA